MTVNKTTWLAITLSTAYLVVELSFNARLLDAFGGVESGLGSLEVWGKTISGFGLTLLAWRVCKYRPVMLPVLMVICIPLMFNLQNAMIKKMTDSASANQRKSAVYVMAVRQALATGHVQIDGIDIAQNDLGTPEGKTFLALFPMIGISSPGIIEKLDPVLPKIIEDTTSTEIRKNSTQAYERYVAAMNDIKSTFNNKYASASDRLSGASSSTRKARSTPESAWGKYIAEMDNRHINIIEMDSFTRQRVIATLHKRGIMVDQSWDGHDKDAFIAAVNTSYTSHGKDYNAMFASETRKAFGKPLPPGMDWASFSTYPAVQEKMRNGLGVGSNVTVNPEWTQSQFEKIVLNPMLTKTIHKKIVQIRQPDQCFADGGKCEADGRAAVKVAYVPAIALGFSCLFGIINMFALVIAVGSMILPQSVHKLIYIIVCITAVTALSMTYRMNNRITESIMFKTISTSMPPILANGTHWLVGVQPFTYPINNAVRQKGMMGFEF